MKHSYLFKVILFLSVVPLYVYSQEYTPDSNTVALYHFNEIGGSIVYDVSGNGNNGTATGTMIMNGKFDLCRNFVHPTIQYITIPLSDSLKPTSSFTVESWIKPAFNYYGSIGGQSPVIMSTMGDCSGSGCGGYGLGMFDPNQVPVKYNFYFGVSMTGGGKVVHSVSLFDSLHWFHVAGIYTTDGINSSVKILINGKIEDSLYVPGQTISYFGATTNLYIGNQVIRLDGYRQFWGLIDEVRISKIARTPQEFNLQLPPINLSASAIGTTINLSWQNGGGGIGLLQYRIYRGTDSTTQVLIDSTTSTYYANRGLSPAITYYYRVSALDSTGFEGAKSYSASATIPSVSGLVAHYPFNGNANDESGNGNNGTVVGATLGTDRFGNTNRAYRFDGVNNYIKASASNLPTTDRTVSLWFCTDSLNGSPTLMDYGGGVCGTSFTMLLNEPLRPNMFIATSHCNENTNTYTYSTPPTGRWYHWIVASDSNGTKFYIDGNLVHSSSVNYTNTNVVDKDLAFGVVVCNSGKVGECPGDIPDSYYLKGKLDDIRIYNYAITDSEVQLLYHEGEWEMGGAIGGVVFNDANGNGYRDSNETGMSYWRIWLIQNELRIDSALTDQSGSYRFSNLDAGTYVVREEQKSGWEQTLPGLLNEYTVILANGQNVNGKDFGNHRIDPKVRLALTVHNSGNTSQKTIFWGVRPGASFGIWGVDPAATIIDSLEGEFEIPPIINGMFDVRFQNPNGTSALFGNGSWVDVRNLYSTTQTDTYQIAFQPGPADYPVTFCWSPTLVTKMYRSTVTIGETPVTGIDMKTNDSLVISSQSINKLYIIAKSPGFPVKYERGWNIVSVPDKVVDPRKHILFPYPSSVAFFYNPLMGYELKDSLTPGYGYWIKFVSIVPFVSFLGEPRTQDTIDVAEGWNIVGTLSVPIPVIAVQSIPPGIITGDFYGYNKQYYTADTLEPMRGYWVKAHQSGKFIFSSNPSRSSLNRILIHPDNELPPPPPGEEISSSAHNLPKEFALEQSYPNPFNPKTTIKYQLPVDSKVSLKIYNQLGQVIQVLIDGVQEGGYKTIDWNASNFASGVYFSRLEAVSIDDPTKTFTQVRKTVLIK